MQRGAPEDSAAISASKEHITDHAAFAHNTIIII